MRVWFWRTLLAVFWWRILNSAVRLTESKVSFKSGNPRLSGDCIFLVWSSWWWMVFCSEQSTSLVFFGWFPRNDLSRLWSSLLESLKKSKRKWLTHSPYFSFFPIRSSCSMITRKFPSSFRKRVFIRYYGWIPCLIHPSRVMHARLFLLNKEKKYHQ